MTSSRETGSLMARVLKPPTPLDLAPNERSVFLAGSIEMGRAEDWQQRLQRELDDLPVTILNPRRDEWDASWVQSIDNPQFRTQVEWELDALERADVIAMNFAADSKAPITLLELGLFAPSGKVIIACPEGYWRRGNIEVVAARFRVPLVKELSEMVKLVRERL